MFIKGQTAITESGAVAESEITPATNVVYIYPKMPYAVKNAVMGAASTVDMKTPRGKRANNANVEFNLGQWNQALLLHNVIGWAGPAFAEYPYSHDAKIRLIPLVDDSEPLWQRVIQEINDRNKAPETAADEGASPNETHTSNGA